MVILNKLEEATTLEELVIKFNYYFSTIQKINSTSELEETFFKAYLDLSISLNYGDLIFSELGLKVLRGPEKSKAWIQNPEMEETFWDSMVWVKEIAERISFIQWAIINRRSENLDPKSRLWPLMLKIIDRLNSKIRAAYRFIHIIFCLLLRFYPRETAVNYLWPDYECLILHSIDKIWYLVREFDQEETSLRQKEFTTFREYWVLYDSFLFKAKGIVEKDFYLKEDFFSKKWEEFLEGKWDLKKRNTKV